MGPSRRRASRGAARRQGTGRRRKADRVRRMSMIGSKADRSQNLRGGGVDEGEGGGGRSTRRAPNTNWSCTSTSTSMSTRQTKMHHRCSTRIVKQLSHGLTDQGRPGQLGDTNHILGKLRIRITCQTKVYAIIFVNGQINHGVDFVCLRC